MVAAGPPWAVIVKPVVALSASIQTFLLVINGLGCSRARPCITWLPTPQGCGQSASRFPSYTPTPHDVCLRPDALALAKIFKNSKFKSNDRCRLVQAEADKGENGRNSGRISEWMLSI